MINNFILTANKYGKQKIPFMFLIDFELKKPKIFKISETIKNNIFFDINGYTNYEKNKNLQNISKFKTFPISYEKYLKSFDYIIKNMNAGNTYLANLTFPTKIKTNNSLSEIFHFAQAQYKLFYKNELLIFSPESFVQTKNNHIFSYPMKGTINAKIPNAENIILSDKKETWEHNTIVDLIRNDLAIVSKNITVEKFRFITKITTNNKTLLQVSSEIKGELKNNWQKSIGNVLSSLLPAGSISGAPKRKTVEIISNAEKIDRGYFTGVFGVFDGENLNSAVNIRYIENTKEGLFFRSGGGLTAHSNAKNEYNEMVNKVYVPIS